jgi:hypothetical protein
MLEGDYEAGAAAAQSLLEWGDREHAQGRASTAITVSFHVAAMMSLLTERGEFGRMVPDLEQVLEREQGQLPGWRVMRAWADLQAGRRARARATIEELASDDFRALPRDVNFVPTLALLAHIAGELGEADLAAGVEPLLAPYRPFWTVFGIGAATLGPVAYSVGLLRLVQGRADDAIPCFELAMERSTRCARGRTWRARKPGWRVPCGCGAPPGTRDAPSSWRRRPVTRPASSGCCGWSASSRARPTAASAARLAQLRSSGCADADAAEGHAGRQQHGSAEAVGPQAEQRLHQRRADRRGGDEGPRCGEAHPRSAIRKGSSAGTAP